MLIRTNILCNSIPRLTSDYDVAKALACHYGCRIGAWGEPKRGLDVREAFRVWELGSLGVYLPMRPPARSSSSVAGPPRLAGHLASSRKFFRKPARDMTAATRVGNLFGASTRAAAALVKE